MTPQILTLIGALYALSLTFIIGYLIWRGKMEKRTYILILGITAISGFILLGPFVPTKLLDLLSGTQQGQIALVMVSVLGLLLLSALVWGRSFCAYACPIGAFQELAYRVPVQKARLGKSHALAVRYLVTVAIIAAAILLGRNLLQELGLVYIFHLDFGLYSLSFLAIILASMIVYRPFCRLLCPFGALSALLARHSMFQMQKNESCVDCGRCEKACPTGEISSDGSECYLCMRCLETCRKDGMEFRKRRAP